MNALPSPLSITGILRVEAAIEFSELLFCSACRLLQPGLEYKNEQSLRSRLDAFCKDHDYTKRYEAFLQKKVRPKKLGQKKRLRNLALKLIRWLDGKPKVRRADITQAMQATGYTEAEINDILKKLHDEGLLKVSPGRYADVVVA